MALTTKSIPTLKPGRHRDGLVKGLYLQVVNDQNKSWILRYVMHGRERWLGLGPLHLVGLKEARERARAARLSLLDGVDPLLAKQERKAAAIAERLSALTFEQAAQRYYAEHQAKWKTAKARAQFLSSLRDHAYPVIGKLPVGDIDTAAVLRVLKPIWHSKTMTATRVRSRIEAVLAWATVNGFRTGDNPAKWRGHLKEALPAASQISRVKHHPTLPYKDLPEFMLALRAGNGITTRALEFLILTGARTGEIAGATWDEINLDEKVWIVPAARMKAGREHRVPLADDAIALLNALPREDGNKFVFVGSKADAGLAKMAMSQTLKRLRSDLTVHGFRSTFRDWAGNETHFPREVCEAALAHVIGDKSEQAYRRGDALAKRRLLMEAWANYCSGLHSERLHVDGEVVPLRGAR